MVLPSFPTEAETKMGQPKQARNIWGSLKDKISVVKASSILLSSRRTTSLQLSIVKATSHNPSTSPPPHFISDLRHHSSAARDALINRLRTTRDPYVALKCLLSLHHLLPDLHHRLPDLPNFRGQSHPDTCQLSLWARWFARQINSSLLLRSPHSEFDALVSLIEHLGTAPESLHYQTIGVIHDAMKLAGEDYRIAMRRLFARIQEIQFGELIGLAELIGMLDRLLGCKQRMVVMFLNKKQNDGVWDAVVEAKQKAEEEMRRRDDSRVMVGDTSRRTRGGRWLDVDWNKPVTVSTTA